MNRSLPFHADGIHLLRHGTESVLCDADDRRLYLLNETASALWELCDGETRLDEMVDAVCLVCDVPRDRAMGDVDRAISELSQAGLITWR